MPMAILSAKDKVPTVVSYEKILKKNPGDMDTYCALVDMLLTQSDTVRAEEHLTYALRLRPTYACLLTTKARIALARGKQEEAVISYADAIIGGYVPEDDSTFWYLADYLGARMQTRLRVASQRDRTNTSVLRTMALWHLHDGDTAAAVIDYREMWRRSQDSTILVLIDSLEALHRDTTMVDSVVACIPFTRKLNKIEIRCVVNGLRLNAILDTTATESTISGVELDFMRKNDYVLSDDILDTHTLSLRSLTFADEHVRLQDVRMAFRRMQDDPLIFCPQTFEKLGSLRLNEDKHLIEIVVKKKKNN